MNKINFRVEASEKDIEDCIEQHCDSFLNLKYVGRQIYTPSGIIDVLARCPEDNETYFVIEIKKDYLDSKSACQVMRYAAYLNSEKSKNGKRVFIPMLIGQRLCDDLTKLVRLYDGGYVNPMNVYYKLLPCVHTRGLVLIGTIRRRENMS